MLGGCSMPPSVVSAAGLQVRRGLGRPGLAGRRVGASWPDVVRMVGWWLRVVVLEVILAHWQGGADADLAKFGVAWPCEHSAAAMERVWSWMG